MPAELKVGQWPAEVLLEEELQPDPGRLEVLLGVESPQRGVGRHPGVEASGQGLEGRRAADVVIHTHCGSVSQPWGVAPLTRAGRRHTGDRDDRAADAGGIERGLDPLADHPLDVGSKGCRAAGLDPDADRTPVTLSTPATRGGARSTSRHCGSSWICSSAVWMISVAEVMSSS